MNDTSQLSAHFRATEFACHHCGRLPADETELMRLVAALESLRTVAATPIVVLSGYRCPEHNAAIGGEPDSRHLTGAAADIQMRRADGSVVCLQGQYNFARQISAFGGIGVYDNEPPFIHVDVRPRKPDGSRALWSRVKGIYGGIEELVTP